MRAGGGELTLEQVILGRVARLVPGSQALMEVIGVAGGPIPQRVAIEAAGLRFEEAAAMATLRVAHLARTYKDGEIDIVRAYHDRITETVVAHLEPQRLRDCHLRLAETLERQGHLDSETLLVHYRAAGNLPRLPSMRHGPPSSQRAHSRSTRRLACTASRSNWAPSPARNEKRFSIALGDALVNAGLGQEAARVYLEIAKSASPYLALELTRRAGEHLLRNGHIDEGLAAIGHVLSQLDIRRAETPNRALLYLLWRRVTTRTRGLAFEERDESEISRADLTRIDVCWSATVVTGMVDTIRGAEMQARHLPLALRIGEPYRICRALCIEAVHVASEGVASRVRFRELINLAEQLAGHVRHPHAIALTQLARGMGTWVFGEWSDTVALCEKADGLLRDGCHGVAWEIGTARICMARAFTMLGQLSRLADLAERTARHARDRGDRFSAWAGVAGWPVLGKIAVGAGDAARAELREVYADWSRKNFSVQDHWACLGEGLLDLQAGRAEAAFGHLDAADRAHQKAQLHRVQIIRIDLAFIKATAALAVSGESRSNREHLGVAVRLAKRSRAKVCAGGPPLRPTSCGGPLCTRRRRAFTRRARARGLGLRHRGHGALVGAGSLPSWRNDRRGRGGRAAKSRRRLLAARRMLGSPGPPAHLDPGIPQLNRAPKAHLCTVEIIDATCLPLPLTRGNPLDGKRWEPPSRRERQEGLMEDTQ